MPPAKRLERLNKIQREVKKMTELLEEVLTMGRAGAGKLISRPEPFDVIQLAEECLEQAQLIATPKHCLVLESSGLSQNQFVADPQLLTQAVTNLLINGIKYSPEGGDILLKISGDDDRLVIAVKDRGIGIPKAELPQIFESFYRANNVGNISGTGLGLAIAQAVVELHHGTIEVDSTEGQGTTFTITIPQQKTHL
jgi:signal transduction histidine kinase